MKHSCPAAHPAWLVARHVRKSSIHEGFQHAPCMRQHRPQIDRKVFYYITLHVPMRRTNAWEKVNHGIPTLFQGSMESEDYKTCVNLLCNLSPVGCESLAQTPYRVPEHIGTTRHHHLRQSKSSTCACHHQSVAQFEGWFPRYRWRR